MFTIRDTMRYGQVKWKKQKQRIGYSNPDH